ncbi:uncharacterized protein MONOS_11364 [Monocercomonoides exilis]|uniref:uncharacterized protein n=1 Tax=Monocercomonoides exilis TaxID=2049356 RepID=UPI00355A7C77|nr:hypothetical protein MONOS_11364 [Monocercomonoides exilis]|eukprot:MONOS_11364.1-p1 / transcript=MONOS_11364.1 / gene=MONOS_11364 / organism=Monocercomonoides_exilis_PA203 / gene_product=unspecified product / transcript_product=unspecified product / location=Mono_scaffold00566:26255-27537(+) / protein_length=407 / sequence_SO=supercontig / SO=protein_coding / is_pseudo=false
MTVSAESDKSEEEKAETECSGTDIDSPKDEHLPFEKKKMSFLGGIIDLTQEKEEEKEKQSEGLPPFAQPMTPVVLMDKEARSSDLEGSRIGSAAAEVEAEAVCAFKADNHQASQVPLLDDLPSINRASLNVSFAAQTQIDPEPLFIIEGVPYEDKDDVIVLFDEEKYPGQFDDKNERDEDGDKNEGRRKKKKKEEKNKHPLVQVHGLYDADLEDLMLPSVIILPGWFKDADPPCFDADEVMDEARELVDAAQKKVHGLTYWDDTKCEKWARFLAETVMKIVKLDPAEHVTALAPRKEPVRDIDWWVKFLKSAEKACDKKFDRKTFEPVNKRKELYLFEYDPSFPHALVNVFNFVELHCLMCSHINGPRKYGEWVRRGEEFFFKTKLTGTRKGDSKTGLYPQLTVHK